MERCRPAVHSQRPGLTLRSTGRATAFVARASFHSGPAAARCRTPVSFTLGLMIRPVCALTAALVLTAPFVTAIASPSIAQVERSLKNQGPSAVLHRYFDCGATGVPAYRQIASGNAQWLNLAARLVAEADGCFSLLLSSAIAEALPSNPSAVLSLVKSSEHLTPDRMCLPFMSEDIAIEVHLATLQRAEKALHSVKSKQLSSSKQACLEEVRRARTVIK